MSVESIASYPVSNSLPPMAAQVPSVEDTEKMKTLTQTKNEQPFTQEERKQKMKEANARYMFDQMVASVRRHNQEMQKQLQEQKEEDARNGYA